MVHALSPPPALVVEDGGFSFFRDRKKQLTVPRWWCCDGANRYWRREIQTPGFPEIVTAVAVETDLCLGGRDRSMSGR
ncbi:hypothetical protein HanPI659440_Chr04g0173691 [Helianthus annuus]|nr:hypothetical protein HanPI659440_Chr04g0173691 [Helianthus annuus]